MSAESGFDFAQFESFISSVEKALSPTELFAKVDDLSTLINQEVRNYQDEIQNMTVDEKRKLALETTDEYRLNLLVWDENLNVRTLALCNPNISPNLLNRLIDEADLFTLMVIANNPSAPSPALDRIFDLSNGEIEILTALANNPASSEVLKYRAQSKISSLPQQRNQEYY